jgi:hypothetical protein
MGWAGTDESRPGDMLRSTLVNDLAKYSPRCRPFIIYYLEAKSLSSSFHGVFRWIPRKIQREF